MSARKRRARTRRRRRVENLRIKNSGKANDGTRYHRRIGGRTGRVKAKAVAGREHERRRSEPRLKGLKALASMDWKAYFGPEGAR